MKHIKTGKTGEEIATKFLLQKGYEVVDRNVKLSYYEIDIVARKSDIYYFVEVKTRTNYLLGGAEDALGAKKLRLFKKAIMSFCYKHKIDLEKIFGDFLAINLDYNTKTANIKHFKNIF